MTTRWPEVTMGDFARLCRRRGYTIDYLVEHFGGKFGCADGMVRETTRQYVERVFEGRFAGNVIPFACLLTFYVAELGHLQDSTGTERRCGCGCGQRVFGRKRWASSACKQRAYRERGGGAESGPKKAA